jgi:hypothetical protein
MNIRWEWIPRTILLIILILFSLSVWTLFLPNGGHGIMSFGVMFPAWLITITLAILFLALQED